MTTDASLAINFITDLVKQRYQEDASQHAPTVFAFKDGQVGTIIQLDFDNDHTKSASIHEAERILKQQDMDGSVFISEAWMLEQPANELIPVRPRDSERRIEVLIAEASTKGQHVSAIYKIERDSSGNFIGFTEFQRYDSSNTKGSEVKSRFNFFN